MDTRRTKKGIAVFSRRRPFFQNDISTLLSRGINDTLKSGTTENKYVFPTLFITARPIWTTGPFSVACRTANAHNIRAICLFNLPLRSEVEGTGKKRLIVAHLPVAYNDRDSLGDAVAHALVFAKCSTRRSKSLVAQCIHSLAAAKLSASAAPVTSQFRSPGFWCSLLCEVILRCPRRPHFFQSALTIRICERKVDCVLHLIWFQQSGIELGDSPNS
ncbi:uncharacterized protein ATNIH1004_007138 [Aspergillus tanneri]|uniref:Uncharacterized protein n=1 Tax=Aspergillus tanneri TaxID=1220188 RepID=A0A5M9MMN5_9EURO|nr:uncharacterized protein ATNIH1004_007138 [Aspergillus tanneri]KAA8645719.1 hypothetical protein ATNIH1004_007138 [Aspergillus tanneri]